MKNFYRYSTVAAMVWAWFGLAQSGAIALPVQGSQGAQQKEGQQGPGGAQPPARPQISQEEIQAFQAIQNELDPDRAIQLVNDFEKKFPSSRGLPDVYLKAASFYQQKGDLNHAAEYGEKSLKIFAENPVALILVASILPQPASLQGSDLIKEKKLAEAEEYATKALKLIEQLPKQPNIPEEQWNEGKATLSSMAHSSLGMVHLQRSATSLTGADPEELAKAEKEYQAAVSITKNIDPADYFRLGEVEEKVGKVDAAKEAYKNAGKADQGGQIKALADQAIERLEKKKGEAKPPAKP